MTLWWWPQVAVVGICFFLSSAYRNLKAALLCLLVVMLKMFILCGFMHSPCWCFDCFVRLKGNFRIMLLFFCKSPLVDSQPSYDLSVVFGISDNFLLPDILSSFGFEGTATLSFPYSFALFLKYFLLVIPLLPDPSTLYLLPRLPSEISESYIQFLLNICTCTSNRHLTLNMI